MFNGLVITDTEQEFLDLMNIEVKDNKLVIKNTDIEFGFGNVYKQRPHSRTDVVYVYPFKYKDIELLFFRKDNKPTLESLVIKQNGEKYIVGESFTEDDYPRRFITFVGKEPEYYNKKIHVITKPFTSGKYFFETRVLFELGRVKYSEKVKFGPEEAIDNEIYYKKYHELINEELADSKEAKDFFLKVFSFFNNNYLSSLEIPVIYSDNFFESLSNEEEKVDEINNQSIKERNEQLLDISKRRRQLEEYIQNNPRKHI